MKLYEEIIFLKHYFPGKWIVENVRPYYEPLIEPTTILQRHYVWSNFAIPVASFASTQIGVKNKLSDFDTSPLVSASRITNKRQVLRNCVDPLLGLHVFKAANEQYQQPLIAA